MRGIRIDSRMPDHQVLEAGYLFGCLLHLDFAIFGLQLCESPGCRKNQFGSRNTPRSRSEIWQGNHGTTAMTVRCETLSGICCEPSTTSTVPSCVGSSMHDRARIVDAELLHSRPQGGRIHARVRETSHAGPAAPPAPASVNVISMA
jgi:hypothetical protein